MGRIETAFTKLAAENRKGFIPFITAGDPDLQITADLLLELSASGATVIELGVPFSDPMADGVVIQRASERALQQGFGLKELLDLVARTRKQVETPIVLFSYFNPLFQYGLEELARDAGSAGVDGILVTDLIPEEAREFAGALRTQNLDMIFLVAPTSTDERLSRIAAHASGFVYAVSRPGVTGARAQLSTEAELLVTRMRRFSQLPIAVGFGISNAAQVADTLRYADAAVVGSAIVAKIEELAGAPDLVKQVGKFVRGLVSDGLSR